MAQFPLKEHQQENIGWIDKVKRGLLADEPGLGKTRSAIESIRDQGFDNALIIAPNLICRTGVWQDEIEKWAPEYADRITIAPYTSLNDREWFTTPAGNKKLRPINKLRPEYKGPFNAVVLDEAHYMKGRDTIWTKLIHRVAKPAEMVIPMTGTPIPNWSHELFTVLQLIYPEEAGRGQKYGAFWRWAEQWFDTSPTRFSQGKPSIGTMLGCTPKCDILPPDNPCKHYRAFVADNLGDRWMRHLRDDCLDLPPLNFETVDSPMDAETRRAYKSLARNFAASLKGGEILAWSQGAKNVILDRMTTSPWLLNPVGEPEGGKLDLLDRDLEEIVGGGEQVLVLAHYRDSVEACARVASRYGPASYVHGGQTNAQQEKAVIDFKAGKSRVLAGSLETLAEGLTLTMANTAIFVERSYKPSRNTQATYRIHRMGQENECLVKKYLTPNSVDSKKETLLSSKTDHQMRTMTAADYLRIL